MKFSDYHESHGLSGHIRNPKTGEMLHFHFQKGGDNRIYLQVNMGGTEVEGYLTLAPRSTDHVDDVQDMVVHLVAPNGRPAAARQVVAEVKMLSGPMSPILRKKIQGRDVDGAPMSDGHIQQNAPQQRLDPQLERMSNNTKALGSRVIQEAMRDDGPPLPYQEQNARVDKDMGRKGATQGMLTGQTSQSSVPSYERVPTIAEAMAPQRPPADDGAKEGEPLLPAATQEREEGSEGEEPNSSLDNAPESPFDFAQGEQLLGEDVGDEDLVTETIASDPTAVPEDPRIPGFKDGPAPNPDPNWGGTKTESTKHAKHQKSGVQRGPSRSR